MNLNISEGEIDMEVPAHYVNHICREQNHLIVERLKGQIRAMGVDVGDMQNKVLMARRTALMNAIEIVEDTRLSKPYRFYATPPIQIQELSKPNGEVVR